VPPLRRPGRQVAWRQPPLESPARRAAQVQQAQGVQGAQADVEGQGGTAAAVSSKPRSWQAVPLEGMRSHTQLSRVQGTLCQGKRLWQECVVDGGPSQSSIHGGQRFAALSSDTLAFLSNLPKKQKLNKYDTQAIDVDRVTKTLGQKVCSCKRDCGSQFSVQELVEARSIFHQLREEDRQYLLHTMYRPKGLGSFSSGSTEHLATSDMDTKWLATRAQWSFCGHQVCVQAFCKLLPVGAHKLYKGVKMALDMRRSMPGCAKQVRPCPQRQVSDNFFIDLYRSAAEPLPTDFTLSGVDQLMAEPVGQPDSDDDNRVHGSGFQVEAPGSGFHVPDPDDAMDWDPDRPLHQIIADCAGHDLLGVPIRMIPHGKLTDLYWQFLAYCACIELKPSSIPSWSTFRRVWVDKWQAVLKFRPQSSHAGCQTCFELHQKIYGTWAKPAEKFSFAAAWRQHLQDQYHDRMIYWSLRFASRQAASDVLVLIIDSMDKAKLAWPRYTFDKKPHELDAVKIPRPRSVLTAAMAHGWCTSLFLADDALSHGASAFCEVLAQTLDHVYQKAKVQGVGLPSHLVIQSDNTVAQAKNSEVAQFLAHLVAARKFSTCTLNFLMVGHTHEDVDQLFGLVCATVVHRQKWETVDDLAQHLKVAVGPHICNKGEDVRVIRLEAVRDFKSWLAPQGVKVSGSFRNRDGIETPHSFIYKRRGNLNKAELDLVQDNIPRAVRYAGYDSASACPGDVYCMVKTYMRDLHYQQAPVLVLPADRGSRVQGPSPTTFHTVELGHERRKALETLAALYEREMYGYYNAALKIRAMLQPDPPTLPRLTWLEESPSAPEDFPSTQNKYFPHLPESSWHMLVQFHRHG